MNPIPMFKPAFGYVHIPITHGWKRSWVLHETGVLPVSSVEWPVVGIEGLTTPAAAPRARIVDQIRAETLPRRWSWFQ